MTMRWALNRQASEWMEFIILSIQWRGKPSASRS
jgi:hypothetical protein